MPDPFRDPDSQALIFPADESVDLAAQSVEHVRKMYVDVLSLREQVLELVDFLTDLPKPAGMNVRLDVIKSKLQKIGNQ